jgi:hypothetical protein
MTLNKRVLAAPAETAAKPTELAFDLGEGAEMLAPSRFYAHIGLAWG